MVGGLLGKIFGVGVSDAVKAIGGVIDKVKGGSAEEKLEATKAIEEIMSKREDQLQETLRTEIGSKERLMIAEMQSGDKFTKRARPSVVYTGLLLMIYNYAVIPTIGHGREPAELPMEFWIAWGGVVSVWSYGRSSVRQGKVGKMTEKIAGAKSVREW